MINYSIEPKGNGYTLTVWESAPLTEHRTQPFFFKAKYALTSPLEAFGLLRLFQGGKAFGQIPKNRRKA
jgi:hypothetical protein